MSAATLLLICLAAGFYAGTKWKVSKVFISKDSGHPLYFLSALFSLFLVVFALAANKLVGNFSAYETIYLLAQAILRPLVKQDELERLSNLALLTVWVVAFSIVLPRFLNWPLNSNDALLDQIAESYGEREAIDDVIRDALRLQLPVAVSLDDSKVYIGCPISGEPFGVASRRWLSLRPMFSGYRDEKKELDLTTDYQVVITGLSVTDGEESVVQGAFDVVVPFDRIVSIHPFDLESYSKYFVGAEWTENDQLQRLQALSKVAKESAPNRLHKRDYWAFALVLVAWPVISLIWSSTFSLLILLLSVAFGLQAAYPIQEDID